MQYSFVTLAASLLSTASLALAVPGADLFERQAGCNADLCLRALRGQGTAAADCSNGLRTTLVGCGAAGGTVTVTSTVTSTSTSVTSSITTVGSIPTGPGGPAKRQASVCSTTTNLPGVSNIPRYASACSSIARYSSACSCIGVTGTATTIQGNGPAITTTTIVVTSTTVTVSTAVATQQPSTQGFQLVLPGGRRVAIFNDNLVPGSSSTNPNPATFTLDSDGILFLPSTDKFGIRVGVKANTGKDLLYALRYNQAGTRLRCTLSDPANSKGALVCDAGGNQRFPVLCNELIYYSITRDQPGCAAIDLQAV